MIIANSSTLAARNSESENVKGPVSSLQRRPKQKTMTNHRVKYARKKKATAVASDGRMNNGRDRSWGFSEMLNATSMKAREKLKTQAIISMRAKWVVGIL
ncbi:MAG: hypothetical protein ACREOB_04320, partial [Thermodesulfobacteriota bacterium]